jgi:hypothetical protein
MFARFGVGIRALVGERPGQPLILVASRPPRDRYELALEATFAEHIRRQSLLKQKPSVGGALALQIRREGILEHLRRQQQVEGGISYRYRLAQGSAPGMFTVVEVQTYAILARLAADGLLDWDSDCDQAPSALGILPRAGWPCWLEEPTAAPDRFYNFRICLEPGGAPPGACCSYAAGTVQARPEAGRRARSASSCDGFAIPRLQLRPTLCCLAAPHPGGVSGRAAHIRRVPGPHLAMADRGPYRLRPASAEAQPSACTRHAPDVFEGIQRPAASRGSCRTRPSTARVPVRRRACSCRSIDAFQAVALGKRPVPLCSPANI